MEAAVRSGHPDIAATAVEQLTLTTRPSGTDWALGIEARRALLGTGETAEADYVEAINRLERSPVQPEAARAHLLYGEWLRRRNRRRRRAGPAPHRRTSGFACHGHGSVRRPGRPRARRRPATRLRKAHRRGTPDDLTPQERQIARAGPPRATRTRRSARGSSSAGRTVEWHLRKVFTKLDVSSRNDLRDTLPRLGLVPAS